MTEQFTDSVLINCDCDETQLTVRGTIGQTQPLQEWVDSNGNVLASITAEGGFEGIGLAVDAQNLPYTPAILSDWAEDDDPGNVSNGLDQLAQRVTSIEATSGGGGGSGSPTGSVTPFAGSSAPSGWLLCNGQAVSRATYNNLFALISTTYGSGNGSTTFNVPDLRGRFPLGLDNMGGNSANRVTANQADNLGQGAGAESHTLTVSEMPSHSHTQRGRSSGDAGTANALGLARDINNANGGDTLSTGGGGAHNNMPPYLTLSYIIKT